MFNGHDNFEVIEKRRVGNMTGIVVSAYEDNEQQIYALINSLDSMAKSYGYEYHSMTDTCVVFKRAGRIC